MIRPDGAPAALTEVGRRTFDSPRLMSGGFNLAPGQYGSPMAFSLDALFVMTNLGKYTITATMRFWSPEHRKFLVPSGELVIEVKAPPEEAQSKGEKHEKKHRQGEASK